MCNRELNGQRGFTLIELLAVMAIIGILAAVVLSTTSDTPDKGDVAANQQSASALDSAVVDFVSAREDAAIISASTVTVVTEINSDDDRSASNVQVISSRQPEKFITANPGASSTAIYFNEFPTAGTATEDIVVNVVLVDSNGDPISRADFLEGHTAIDVALMEELAFLSDTLESATSLTKDTFHNFLWTFKKAGSADGDDSDTRVIEGFRLITITELSEESGSTLPEVTTLELKYEQFF